MSWFHTTEDYDISSSYLGDKITKEDSGSGTTSPNPPKPTSDDGSMSENERGHTNYEDQKQR